MLHLVDTETMETQFLTCVRFVFLRSRSSEEKNQSRHLITSNDCTWCTTSNECTCCLYRGNCKKTVSLKKMWRKMYLRFSTRFALTVASILGMPRVQRLYEITLCEQRRAWMEPHSHQATHEKMKATLAGAKTIIDYSIAWSHEKNQQHIDRNWKDVAIATCSGK